MALAFGLARLSRPTWKVDSHVFASGVGKGGQARTPGTQVKSHACGLGEGETHARTLAKPIPRARVLVVTNVTENLSMYAHFVRQHVRKRCHFGSRPSGYKISGDCYLQAPSCYPYGEASKAFRTLVVCLLLLVFANGVF